MPIHMLAWSKSEVQVTDDSLTPLVDPIIPQSSSLYLLPKMYNMIGAYVGGVALDRCKIVQPSIRQICDDFIRPANLTLLPGDNAPLADYRNKPFPLQMNENLDLQATTTAAGPNVIMGLVWISTDRGLAPMPAGNIYTMRGTGTTTATAAAWSLVTVTWANTLPAGNYAVVGLEAVGTTLKGARLIFPNGVERPGCPGLATSGIRTYDGWFRKGGLGMWGTFQNWNLPQVEVFCGSGDTAQTFYLDIVPLF